MTNDRMLALYYLGYFSNLLRNPVGGVSGDVWKMPKEITAVWKNFPSLGKAGIWWGEKNIQLR